MYWQLIQIQWKRHKTYERHTDKLVHITVNGDEIITTYEHPFYVVGKGFVNAPKAVVIKLANGYEFCIEFHPGDTIYYINGNQIGCTGPSYMRTIK